MPVSDLGRGRVNRPAWLLAAACVVASYLLITFSHFTLGELSMDDAATFSVALHPLRDLAMLPVHSQGQPPLFFVALHGWLRIGDTEPVLRALPLVFMACAALTLLSMSWLTPTTRVVSVSVLLLSGFSQYLTPALRPYSLAVWFSLWSCLLFSSLLREPRRGAIAYVWYVVATLLLAYSLTLAVWTLLAQGLCAVAAVVIAAVRTDRRRAIQRYGALLLSLAVVAALYLPHAIGFLRFQSALARPALWVTLATIVNPRYYVSGPVYLLAMPGRLGYLALALAVFGVWGGARDRDPLVGVLVTVIVIQIAATHGLLAGRYGFAFRYLTPAYPALCLLAGIGADRWLSHRRHVDLVLAACAACVLAAAIVSFARAPHTAPTGSWRAVAAEFRRMPGTKLVFFDIGWDSQRLTYEVRHDPDVRMMADVGSGWDSFGRIMTSQYVARTIDREAGPGMMFFYHLDAVQGSKVFDEAFVPGMLRHRCARVYRREVPTYVRDDPHDAGGLLYGYSCSGA